MDAIDQEVIDRHIELSLGAALAPDERLERTRPSRPRRHRQLAVATMMLAAAVVVTLATLSRGEPDLDGAARRPMQDPAPTALPLVTVRSGDDTRALPIDTRAVECLRLEPTQFAGLRRLQRLDTLVISGRDDNDEDVLFGSRWDLPHEAIELFSAFPDLRVLHVTGDLVADGLAPLTKLTKLEELQLHDNEVVTDEHVAMLERMPALRRLHVEGRGAFADAALQRLLSTVQFTQLALRGTFGLSSAGYHGLELQRSLQTLDLSAPWYYGGPPGQTIVVADPTEPQWPDDTTHAVDDSVLLRIGRLGSLRELRLQSRPKVTDAGLGHLSALTRLERLDLHQCLGVTIKGLGRLPASLRDLDLGETTRVTGLPPQLTGLTKLSLANGTAFVDDGLRPIGSMTELRWLDVTGCPRLTKACASVLSSCTRLESLNLHANAWIDDDVLRIVAKLHELRTLDVGSFDGRFDVPTGEGKNGGRTSITAAGVKGLLALKKLTQLDLSSAPPLAVEAVRCLQPLPLTRLSLWWTIVNYDDRTPDLDALSALWPDAKVEWCEPMEEPR